MPNRIDSSSAAGEVKPRTSLVNSAQKRHRKYKRYDGILAKPIERKVMLGSNSGQQPAFWFKLKGYPEYLWPLMPYLNHLHVSMQLEERLAALFQCYGIDPKEPGGFKDLALSLALRHRRIKFNQHGRAEYWRLYQHYNIDPASPTADKNLVLALAKEHIPGFRDEQVIPRKGTKLEENELTMRSKEETHALASIVVILWRAAEQRGRSPSAREITRIIRSTTQPEGLGREVWQQVRKLREVYKWRNWRGRGERTIRDDVGAILAAVESFNAGMTNHLQSQLIFEIAEEDETIASWLLDRSNPSGQEAFRELLDKLFGSEPCNLPRFGLVNTHEPVQ